MYTVGFIVDGDQLGFVGMYMSRCADLFYIVVSTPDVFPVTCFFPAYEERVNTQSKNMLIRDY